MAIPITVPRLGWNMEQGVFVGWLKADGAPVRAGDRLFTLESEKATEDVECLDSGVLHIPANGPRKGDAVAVGAVIGFVLQPGEAIPAPTPAAPPASKPSVNLAGAAPVSATPRARPASSPRARRVAAEFGVDLRSVNGAGRTGRIRERDVRAFAASASPQATPIRSMRHLIAERMLTSSRTTAPVTLVTTVDATNLVNLRKRLKSTRGDLAPTYTDILVKLAATALAQHPALNSRWEGDRIVSPEGIHIGVAVDADAGLMVPVVRDVPSLSLSQLSARTRDLIERARQRRIAAHELQGGTFTVTSLGAFCVDAFTPIINPPECAVLGVGRIQRRPAVLDDQIVIRDQLTLSLTFDHRITDGAPAARFLQTLSGLIENPPDEGQS
jgi:pyruvate dehydrogenase E2 component (dihydrolipoamide acetyltransferase)